MAGDSNLILLLGMGRQGSLRIPPGGGGAVRPRNRPGALVPPVHRRRGKQAVRAQEASRRLPQHLQARGARPLQPEAVDHNPCPHHLLHDDQRDDLRAVRHDPGRLLVVPSDNGRSLRFNHAPRDRAHRYRLDHHAALLRGQDNPARPAGLGRQAAVPGRAEDPGPDNDPNRVNPTGIRIPGPLALANP